MLVNWAQKWLSFDYLGERIVLHGHPPTQCSFAMIELQLIQSEDSPDSDTIPTAISDLLAQFSDVFATPTQLPPRRTCDPKNPLMAGARPVNI